MTIQIRQKLHELNEEIPLDLLFLNTDASSKQAEADYLSILIYRESKQEIHHTLNLKKIKRVFFGSLIPYEVHMAHKIKMILEILQHEPDHFTSFPRAQTGAHRTHEHRPGG